MDRSRVIVVNPPETTPQPATEAPKKPDRYVSARESFMQEFYRQRAGARKLQHDGKCTGENRPACYETCEFSAYCSEWKHTVRTFF